jgi:hypothetical protein
MKKISNVFNVFLTGGAIIAGVDTLMVLAVVLYGTIYQMLHLHSVSFVIAAVFAAFGVYVLDIALHQLLPDTIKGFAARQHKSHRKLFGFLAFVCILSSAGSIAVTLYCRDFVGHVLYGSPTLKDVSAATSNHMASIKPQIDQYDALIASAAKDKANALKTAGNPTLRDLAASGNAWAKSQLETIREKAAAPFNKAIDGYRADKATLLGEATSTISTIQVNMNAINQMAIESNIKAKNTQSGVQMALAVGGTFMMVIGAIGLGLLYASYSIGKDPFKGETKKQFTPSPTGGNTRNTNPGTGPRTAPTNSHPDVVTEVEEYCDNNDSPVVSGNNSGSFDGFDFNIVNGVTTVSKDGKKFDLTKLKQYYAQYNSRATSSKGSETRQLNSDKATLFKAAIDSYTAPIDAPSNPPASQVVEFKF